MSPLAQRKAKQLYDLEMRKSKSAQHKMKPLRLNSSQIEKKVNQDRYITAEREPIKNWERPISKESSEEYIDNNVPMSKEEPNQIG